MNTWRISPCPTADGWWLCRQAHSAQGTAYWSHVYRDNWFTVYATLEEVFNRIKEQA